MNTSALPIVREVADLRHVIREWRGAGLRVALVPTMGALHEGHLSLVRLGKQKCDRIIASLFVNPRQFAPNEDFDRYPRDETGDAALLASAGCNLLFAPNREVMYPTGFSTNISVGALATMLEGAFRPHFFDGVATVVAKLLIQALPDTALFGEKDYQQLLVIKQMARDLDIPTEIIGCPTIREADGLAMSSRNAYLSPDERRIAARLNYVLHDAIKSVQAGSTIAVAEAEATRHLLAAGFKSVDYVAIRDATTLERLGDPEQQNARILAAAWLGGTRLIDNMPM